MGLYGTLCVCVCVCRGGGRPWQGGRGKIAAVDGCLQLWCTHKQHEDEQGVWGENNIRILNK